MSPTWLPEAPHPRGERLRPWSPPLLARVPTEELSYVLVDEIVGSSVGLAVSPWPRLDDKGRLRFPDGRLMLGSDADTLAEFLHKHRLPRELRERQLRIGDAFAAGTHADVIDRLRDQLEDERRLKPFLDPAEWLRPPVYDITPDAREAAKGSFYAAVAPTLEPEQARVVLENE